MTVDTPETAYGGRNRRWRWLVAGAVVAWIAGWMWFARYHFLDDALIHLRYADFLWERGKLTFDGIESSYGTSSLFYVLILTPFRAVTGSPFVVKAVSSVSYIGLIALIAAQAVRSAGLQRALWIGLAIPVVSPMGVRWLTDGMETSLVAVASVALALIAQADGVMRSTRLRYAGLFLFGAMLLLLRVEMALLIGAASVCIWLRRLEVVGEDPQIGARIRRLAAVVLRDSGLLAGGAICAVAIFALFGQVLPDTAVAKSAGNANQIWGVAALYRIGLSTASSLTLGTGLSMLWAVSLVGAVHAARVGRRGLLPLVAANAVIAVVVVGITVRGQEVAGVRNLVWALMFMTAWNAASIPVATRLPAGVGSALSWRTLAGRTAIIAAAGLLAAVWVVEGYFVKRIVDDRSQAFSDMREHDLDHLSGLPGVAFDIGFVSYFTQGAVCDLNGLVNGREMARITDEERAARCAERSPIFSFVTPSQAAFVHRYVDMSRWVVCHGYLFTNLRVPEPHYLIGEPSMAAQTCPQSTTPYGEADLG